MAMRLRRINGNWVALCATETKAKPNDTYIDDAQDHAIRIKLEHDWLSEGYMFNPKKTRRLGTLTNEELSSVLVLRNEKLSLWLKTATWGHGSEVKRTVYYDSAKDLSLAVMECLLEIEARATPNSKWDTPYLLGTSGVK